MCSSQYNLLHNNFYRNGTEKENINNNESFNSFSKIVDNDILLSYNDKLNKSSNDNEASNIIS